MKKLEGIKFEGVRGTWYEIDRTWIEGEQYILFESEQCGDELPCIGTDSKLNIVELNCFNGFEDVRDTLEG